VFDGSMKHLQKKLHITRASLNSIFNVYFIAKIISKKFHANHVIEEVMILANLILTACIFSLPISPEQT
jgi:hypothetical protein